MTNENKLHDEHAWDENDDLSGVMDSVLNAPGVKEAYRPEHECSWTLLIGDKELESGITALPSLEQEIIKLFFIEGLPIMDIALKLDISADILYGHIKSMKVRLRYYV